MNRRNTSEDKLANVKKEKNVSAGKKKVKKKGCGCGKKR